MVTLHRSLIPEWKEEKGEEACCVMRTQWDTDTKLRSLLNDRGGGERCTWPDADEGQAAVGGKGRWSIFQSCGIMRMTEWLTHVAASGDAQTTRTRYVNLQSSMTISRALINSHKALKIYDAVGVFLIMYF